MVFIDGAYAFSFWMRICQTISVLKGHFIVNTYDCAIVCSFTQSKEYGYMIVSAQKVTSSLSYLFDIESRRTGLSATSVMQCRRSLSVLSVVSKLLCIRMYPIKCIWMHCSLISRQTLQVKCHCQKFFVLFCFESQPLILITTGQIQTYCFCFFSKKGRPFNYFRCAFVRLIFSPSLKTLWQTGMYMKSVLQSLKVVKSYKTTKRLMLVFLREN